MAKRFTDTDKWKDEWYTDLTNDYKIIWQYLLDTCDNAGIYKRNIKLLNAMCNTNVSEQDILKVLNKRIYKLSDEKWLIKKFCIFQYGTDFLNSTNKAVIAVHKILEDNLIIKFTGKLIDYKYGSETKQRKEYTLLIPYEYPTDTLSIGYGYPIDTPKEQEQEQEQEQVKDIEQDKNIVKDNVQEQEQEQYQYQDEYKGKGSTKGIAMKIIDVLMDADSDDLLYKRAVEDWKELGGINGISEIMGWDESQKSKWNEKLNNIYHIKTM
jgi:hypothetical protein